MKTNLYLILILLAIPLFGFGQASIETFSRENDSNRSKKTKNYFLDHCDKFNNQDSRQSFSLKADSILEAYFDTNSQIWISSLYKSYKYDNNQRVKEIYEGGWQPERTTYSYNGNGRLVEEIKEREQAGSGWENDDKVEYTYNSSGNLNIVIEFSWDSQNSSWNNRYRYTYFYNSNGDLTSDERERWSNSNWNLDYRNTYTYTNGLLTERIGQTLQGGSVQSQGRNQITYGSNSLISLDDFDIDVDGFGSFMDESNTRYNYNSSNQYTNIRTSTYRGFWFTSWEKDYFFDFDGNVEEIDGYSEWYNPMGNNSSYNRTELDIDANVSRNDVLTPPEFYNFNFSRLDENHFNNKVDRFFTYYRSSGSSWPTFGDRFTIYYSPLVTSLSNRENDFEFSLFPNPSADVIHLQIPNTKIEVSKIEIFNSLGQLILEEELETSNQESKFEFDISEFKPGLYNLVLNGFGVSASKSFIKSY